MRIYELTIILDPNLDKEGVNSELDKLTDMVKADNGNVLEIQHLGMRRLTFEMNGNNQGNFYTIYFTSPPVVLTKMQASMKLNEAVLRSMTIVLKPSEYESPEKKKSREETDSRRAPERKKDEDSKDSEGSEGSDDSKDDDNGDEESKG